MKSRACIAVFALLPLAASAEPLDYDYLYLSSSETETDDGRETDGDVFGGFWSFTDTLHVFGSYDDAGAYANSGENPAWEYETRTLRAGLGAHVLVGERTMIAPALSILRAKMEVTSPLWTREHEDTGYGAQLDLRHAITHWLELTAGGRYTHVFDDGSTQLVGGVVFHATDWLALGALYHEGDERSGVELTARWYY